MSKLNIPGYKIIGTVGNGGMAVVYLAEEEGLNRKVALKVMHKIDDPSDTGSFSQRFLREAKTVSSLSHPNIVPVFAMKHVNDQTVIAMEHLSGGDLKARILLGITVEQTLRYIAQLADALDYAHQQGIVHRDIKPDNVVFRGQGTPVLTDFGLAKIQNGSTVLTMANMVMGTPAYMSPEQFESSNVGPASDIYSLGVIFVEMLLGNCPYKAFSIASCMKNHLLGPIPTLPTHLAPLQPLINKLLEKEVAQRMSCAAILRTKAMEFINILSKEALASKPSQAQDKTIGESTQPEESMTVFQSDPIASSPKEVMPPDLTQKSTTIDINTELTKLNDSIKRTGSFATLAMEAPSPNDKLKTVAAHTNCQQTQLDNDKTIIQKNSFSPSTNKTVFTRPTHNSITNDVSCNVSQPDIDMTVIQNSPLTPKSTGIPTSKFASGPINNNVSSNLPQPNVDIAAAQNKSTSHSYQEKTHLNSTNETKNDKKTGEFSQFGNSITILRNNSSPPKPQARSQSLPLISRINISKKVVIVGGIAAIAIIVVYVSVMITLPDQPLSQISTTESDNRVVSQQKTLLETGTNNNPTKTDKNTLNNETSESNSALPRESPLVNNNSEFTSQALATEQKDTIEIESLALTINTNPSTAKVQVLNIAPVYKRGMLLAPGKYQIKVSAPGYHSSINTISLSTLQQTFSIRLRELFEFSDTLKSGISGPRMLTIKQGEFEMGCSGLQCDSDAKPLHTITISKPFSISKYEIDFALYDHFAKLTYRNLPDDMGWGRDNRPVINVSWNDANALATWLSAETGETYRLPSEAEWEYVARAGKKSEYYWGDNIGQNKALCAECNSPWDNNSTTQRGKFSANNWDIHDMYGNVWEWTADCQNNNYKNAPTDGTAWNKGECDHRILRGGSWSSTSKQLKQHYRHWNQPKIRQKNYGIRLVREL